MELQKALEDSKNNYHNNLNKLEVNYEGKLQTIEAIMAQMKRKDEELCYIEERLVNIEVEKQRHG
jgi:hypothetical protein